MKKVLETPILAAAGFSLMLACSTVRENGEPNLGNPSSISTDEQRRAIYERGGTHSPQHANPIPPSHKIGLNEKASETNRKKNIEDGSNTRSPANTPLQERPRQLPNTNIDTVSRVAP
ncbi:MAG TPA: hypothetical protein VK927_11740 [Adhaeribacter sp.]|nr:hypothetical protein [Adhaeribacter sp.]